MLSIKTILFGVEIDQKEVKNPYNFIRRTTYGYGDILPVARLAHKAAILIGLMGQFYLVIITAIVVGKNLNQLSNKT